MSLQKRIAHSPAANALYKQLDEVEFAGHTFPVYGSMSWTVSEVRKRPWEEVRAAYMQVTGDTREDVDQDRATDVVAGELQFAWAKLMGKDAALPRLEENQRKRIQMALESKAVIAKPRRQKQPRTTQEGQVAEGTKMPTRGSMGLAAKLINEEGLRDESAIVARVQEAHPNVKNAARHVRYVARLSGVALTRPASTEEVAEGAPAGDSQDPAQTSI